MMLIAICRMLDWHPVGIEGTLSEDSLVQAWLLARLRTGVRARETGEARHEDEDGRGHRALFASLDLCSASRVWRQEINQLLDESRSWRRGSKR